MELPNIPDNFNKILIVISCVIIYFVTIRINESLEYTLDKTLEINSDVRNVNLEIQKSNNNLIFLKEEAHILSKENGMTDLYTVIGNELHTNYKFNNVTPKEREVQKHLYELVTNHRKTAFEIKALRDRNNERVKEIRDIKSLYRKSYYLLLGIAVFAVLLFYVGLRSLNKEYKFEQSIKNAKKFSSDFYFSNCQSCGKKFNSITKHSTNSAGIKNTAYCSECVKNDNFTAKYYSVKDVIAEIKQNKSINIFKKLFIISKVKKLDRWKRDNY